MRTMSDLIDFFMVSNVIDVLNGLFEIKDFLLKVVWGYLAACFASWL